MKMESATMYFCSIWIVHISDNMYLQVIYVYFHLLELTKKQQKERQKKLSAQSVGDLGKKTKSSFRQSLKNMFFRKK